MYFTLNHAPVAPPSSILPEDVRLELGDCSSDEAEIPALAWPLLPATFETLPKESQGNMVTLMPTIIPSLSVQKRPVHGTVSDSDLLHDRAVMPNRSPSHKVDLCTLPSPDAKNFRGLSSESIHSSSSICATTLPSSASHLFSPREDPFVYDTQQSPGTPKDSYQWESIPRTTPSISSSTPRNATASTCAHWQIHDLNIVRRPSEGLNDSSSSMLRAPYTCSTVATSAASGPTGSKSLRPQLFKTQLKRQTKSDASDLGRPLLSRSYVSEVSMFDSDSDSTSSLRAPTLASLKKMFKKGSKLDTAAKSVSASSFAKSTDESQKMRTVHANVHEQRQILHIRNEDNRDVLVYERLSTSTVVLGGTLEMLLTEFTKPASIITDRRFMDVLIHNHRYVMSSLVFFRAISKHFWGAHDTGQMSVALQALEVLTSWLHIRAQDLCSRDALLDMLNIFTEEVRRDGFGKQADILDGIATKFCSPSSGSEHEHELKRESAALAGSRSQSLEVHLAQLSREMSKPMPRSAFILELTTTAKLADYLAAISLVLVRNVLEPESVRYWLLSTDTARYSRPNYPRALDNILKRDAMLECWVYAQIAVSTTTESKEVQFRLLLTVAHKLRDLFDINSMLCILVGLRRALCLNSFDLKHCLDEEQMHAWDELNSYVNAKIDYQSLQSEALHKRAVVPSLATFLWHISEMYAVAEQKALYCNCSSHTYCTSHGSMTRAQSYLQLKGSTRSDLIDLEKFELLQTCLSQYQNLVHFQVEADQNLIGSASFCLCLYLQGLPDSRLMLKHGDLDDFGEIFERDLMKTWSNR